ncbi:MAG: hypothetical protein P8185_06305 [Deltaproteobacteria bacterium]|jgi:hypothetical protein
MKKYVWIIMFLFLTGCLACTHSGIMSKPASYSFTVEIPEGWKKMDYNGYPLYTKEGYIRQLIWIQNRPIGKPFRYTKKKIQKEMLPEEAAQVFVDELKSDQNLVNLRILNNTPATINRHAGFKVLYTYKDEEGQTYKTLYYGFIKEDTFFTLRFTAVDGTYFQRDIGDFRNILKSFQVIKAEKV